MSVSRNSITRLLQPKKTKGKAPPSDSPKKAPNNLKKTIQKESGSYTNKGGIAGDDVFKSLGAKKSQVNSGLPHETRSNKFVPGPDGVVKNARLIISRRKEGGEVHDWIKGAIKHPGALHKSLHVPEGKKIPERKLERAEHSKNPRLRKRADLAATLKGLRKGK